MPKKIVSQKEEVNPKALIVGEGSFAVSFKNLLEEKGVDSVLSPIIPKDKVIYDYLFLLKFSNENYEGFKDKGKNILILESDGEKSIVLPQGSFVKKVLAGDLSLWQSRELGELILQFLFSSSSDNVLKIQRKNDTKPEKYFEKGMTESDDKSFQNNRTVKSAKSFSKYQVSYPSKEVGDPRKATRSIRQVFDEKQKVEKKPKNSRRKVFLTALAGVFLIFFLTAGIFLFYLYRTASIFNNLRSEFSKGSSGSFSQSVKEASRLSRNMSSVYNTGLNIFFPLRYIGPFYDFGQGLSSLYAVSRAMDEFMTAAGELRTPEKGDGAIFDFSMNKLDKMEEKVDLLRKTLYDANISLDRLRKLPFGMEKTQSLIVYYYDSLSSFKKVMPLIKGIMADSEKEKTYLALFQNSMELRPTGGFIGSFAVFKISSGMIKDFRIYDVYDADGQLKGHVDPPMPIRKYLNQPNWFLRDSNFDPDFARSAVWAKWFLEKEMEIKVDAVVGVNLHFIEDILKATGPLTIPDFSNELISSENFFFKAHLYSEGKFFPGSTQKKDFLTAVWSRLQDKLLTPEDMSVIESTKVLDRSLERKNLMFYSDDSITQSVFEKNNWAGRIQDSVCTREKDGQRVEMLKSEECFADYLSVIDMNVGINKVNYFIDKSTVVEKSYTNAGLSRTSLTLTYENSDILENGKYYTNYLRIFTPKGARIINASLNGQALNESNFDIEPYFEDKQIFGTLIKVAPANKAILQIEYILPYPVIKSASQIQLIYQKQPGEKVSPLVLSVKYEDPLVLTPLNFISSSNVQNEIYFTADTSVDRIFEFSLGRK